MTIGQSWAFIPQELRSRPQWCHTLPSDPDPLRKKAPRRAGNYLASDTRPSDWTTFEQACANAMAVGGQVGFIISEHDDLTCIDMDVVNEKSQRDKGEPIDPALWTTQKQLDRYWSICQAFQSYTELSQSGNGLHTWVFGYIGRGCKRDGVEVYSQERFMICTGNIVINQPIMQRQELLEMLVGEMRMQQARNNAELIELEEEIDDYELLERATNADNAEKFNMLCGLTATNHNTGEVGTWHAAGYKSQSEADLALLSIFTFYSRSNEQCRRLFRMAPLSFREKAVKDDRYLNKTLQLIRGRQAYEEQIEAEAIRKAADLAMAMQDSNNRNGMMMHVPDSGTPVVAPAPGIATMAALAPAPLHSAEDGGLPWPPGMAGAIAKYVYNSAPRPVKEVGIVTALGFLAGVCGKAFTIPKSGLNMYITLVARSGVGKEAMHSGMSSLITAAAQRQPPAIKFVDFNKYVSGPALTKGVAANPSFVNVVGEWGRRLKRMSDDSGRDANIQELRTVMTDLYQKSGGDSIVGGLAYSNKEGNIASVSGVAYSMIGETTPSTFYESLTTTMMEDGFLSRFLVIEYDGKRPPMNNCPESEPSKVLGDALAELCTHALTMLDRGTRVPVARTNEAAHLMGAFDIECDDQINSTEDESWRQMYNRASLKVMRLSALLAVADNWTTPCVTEEHTNWALMVVRKDIEMMGRRMRAGDVGTADDGNRYKKAIGIMTEYMSGKVSAVVDCSPQMMKAGVITKRYLQQKTYRLKQFQVHRAGASTALEVVIRNMLDDGYIVEVDRKSLAQDYNYHGKAYRIVDLPRN